MAQYALVNGEYTPVTRLGERATCHHQECGWEMFAKPGNGSVLPHWAHKPGSAHAWSTDSEMGEWHCEVQHLFAAHGAGTEIAIRSTDGTKNHKADIVCADGRIVEAQTRFLNPGDLTSRETTYGDMCWLYDARDSGKWFILNNPADPAQFTWGKPDRTFFLSTKPIYFDTGAGVWILERMHALHRKGNRGRVIYEGRRRKVADNLLSFVRAISSGATFGAPAAMTLIDPRKNNRGVRFRTLTDIEEWIAQDPACTYRTFVLDEAVERQAEEAETQRAAAAQGRHDAQQTRIERFTQAESERMSQLRRDRSLQAVPTPPTERPKLAPADHTDWARLAGLTCNCPPGCTDVKWGDGGICDPKCRPCRIMSGSTYTSPPRRKSAP